MTHSFKVTASVILIDEKENKIALIRRRAQSRAFAGMWALPGGHLEKGETIDNAADRELREETGLEAETLQLFKVETGEGIDPRGDYVHFIYLSTGPTGEIKNGDDAQEAKWVRLCELGDYTFAFNHGELISKALDYIGIDTNATNS